MAAFLNRRVGAAYGPGLLLDVEKDLCDACPMTYDNTLAHLIPGMLAYFDYRDLMRE